MKHVIAKEQGYCQGTRLIPSDYPPIFYKHSSNLKNNCNFNSSKTVRMQGSDFSHFSNISPQNLATYQELFYMI